MRPGKLAVRPRAEGGISIAIKDEIAQRWCEVTLDIGEFSLTLAKGNFVVCALRGDALPAAPAA